MARRAVGTAADYALTQRPITRREDFVGANQMAWRGTMTHPEWPAAEVAFAVDDGAKTRGEFERLAVLGKFAHRLEMERLAPDAVVHVRLLAAVCIPIDGT
jgi:hypothetical protein